MQVLTQHASKRLTSAYKPKTWEAYKAMFMVYMAFCEFTNIQFWAPSECAIIAFIEFLCFNELRSTSIQNYITAIKSQMRWFNLPAHVFDTPKVKLMLRAVENTNSKPPLFKGVFDLEHLVNIVCLCQLLPFTSMYQALYLLAFFGFFRISNLVPVSKSSFHIGKHLCRGDILFEHTQAVVIVKWSKTLQTINKGTYVIIPRLPHNVLCPVKALEVMFHQFPAPPNAPLFSNMSAILTQSQVRTHLSKILKWLHLDSRSFSFHTFRRSGATLAFNNNVSIQNIQRHGTWSSETVHRYIISDPAKASAVADSFKTLFQ